MGTAYFVAQLALFSPNRPPSWDEAIYLSQVTPGVPAAAFAPSRARGVTLLVAPVTLLGGPVAAVRLFLLLASAVALTAASLTWIPTLGRAAAFIPLLLGSSWLGLFYGSEIMPNLWSAIFALAATGVLARRFGHDGRARDAAFSAGLVALVSLVRPLDALVLAAALALSVAIFESRPLRTLTLLAAGCALGWAPWLVEMSMRFGGPAAALRSAGSIGHLSIGGLGDRFLQHLALTDGPTIGPALSPHIPLMGLLWWCGVVVLSALGLARGRDSQRLRSMAAATLGGAGLAALYLLLVSGLAPRFLLPAYALLAVPAAAGLASLGGGRGGGRFGSRAGRAAMFVAFGLVAAWTIWQLETAWRIERTAVASGESPREAGLAIRSGAGAGACAVASTSDWPQIAYASACTGQQLRAGDPGQVAALEDLAARGVRVFLAFRDPPPSGRPPAATTPIRAPSGWFVYELAPAPG
jgi:hypothetical protein